MALFNHLFPYSNLHDINLDWIISIIKSIDPAVIKALQELSPDIIEQVTQKVAEAQAAAIAAQSSASSANTAKENAEASAAEATQEAINASADAALANADAVRAEAAKTEIENSLTPVNATATPTAKVTANINIVTKTGRTGIVEFTGQFTAEKSETYYTTIAKLPFPTFQSGSYTNALCMIISGSGERTFAFARVEGDNLDVESSAVTVGSYFSILGLTYPTA